MTPTAIDRDQLIRDRRWFHRHPELGFEEHQTAGYLLESLAGLDVQVSPGVAGTGIVVLVEGRKPGKTLLVRSDMDALPIQEENESDFISEHPGKMHACGHDGHMAILLGVIRHFAAHRDSLSGTLKFVFQPAEEGPGGALPMIEAGVLDHPQVDAAIGYHLWSELPVGTIGARVGPIMASSDRFTLTIEGKGGHGALPHRSTDAIIAASHTVVALQTLVSREVSPLDPAVVTVGTLKAGDRHNIIASRAVLTGTARSFSAHVRDSLPKRLERMVQGVNMGLGCSCQLEWVREYPAVVNEARMTQLVREAVGRAGFVFEEMEPVMAAEDMSYFLERVPGCFFFIGCGNPDKGITYPHHHARFDLDEDALLIGVQVVTEAILGYLA